MKTILPFLSILFLFSCGSKTAYHIQGSFKENTNEEWIYMVRFMDNAPKVDSAQIIDGTFEFTGEASLPEVYGLSYHYTRDNGVFPFFLEPGKLTIEIDPNNWQMNSRVDGGKVNTEFNHLEKDFLSQFNVFIDLLETKAEIEKAAINSQIEDLFKQHDSDRMDYVLKHPESPISIYYFSKLFFDCPIDTIGSILSSFSPEIQQTAIYASIDAYYNKELKLAHKTPAYIHSGELQDLSVKIDQGSVIQALSALNKNKALYIDIWATWCGPCKQEMPYSKELTEMIDTSKVTMVYLCVSSKEDEWKAAIEQSQLQGQHFLLNEELGNRIGEELGGVHGIPRYAIVDKSGALINTDAPRPSSREIVKILNEL